MDFKLGPCHKCGVGMIKPTKINYNLFDKFDRPSNYCSKCGISLISKCGFCSGKGKARDLSLTFQNSDRYCSECGGTLDPPDDICSACNGKGETYDKNHFCTKW